MSHSAETVLDWADGTYKFGLKIEHLAELQEKCEAGPWYVQWALQSALLARSAGLPPPRDAAASYVIEPIRLGLIGGGMDPVQALKKVRDYVGPGQLNENIQTAFAVLGVALAGAPDEQPGKSGAGKKSANRSRAEK